ncbi:unnamed protein product [Phaedon cochleariae]|uniref:tRNA (carboxymethyluridine(34)-5-O)-methyltransferase n=1 Tax=Phaedon cochleariae TaxID=80249 RepID=A0A9N9X0J1_PHACE|nr:unnamed protein product [Phaedon cochleariae]
MRKIDKKLKKLQHVVLKETGITCNLTPSKSLVIANVGLVNGLTEEIIYEHFSKHGILENIKLLPGKSCCFLSYRSKDSAIQAFKSYNGVLNIAQNEKPIYLLYAEAFPIVQSFKLWNNTPPGLIIMDNFISSEEEQNLIQLCNFESNSASSMKHRQVKHFGFEFRYDNNNIDKDKPLEHGIPKQCDFLCGRLQNTIFKDFCPNQLTVNHYSPGQGIPHHIDTHSAFEDPIMSLSLQSPVVMEFKKANQHMCVLLPQRSLAIMSGECRYDWTHGITPRKYDIISVNNGLTTLERGTRISFTFRKVLEGNCNCSYKANCDSFQEQIAESIIGDRASDLEQEHVHKVYEHIASHFSDTRHKPWPNVLEFVNSFDSGSILVDVGCGNGKYLKHNKNIFDIGCDRSFGLVDVCKENGFEAFIANCLNLPLKDGSADGLISIAVIHHLATEERRFQAIQEMVRILKVGGRGLIYVWAKDQFKGSKKSSYIKQDRKNRIESTENESMSHESNKEMTVLDGISLPVHVNRTQFKHQDVLVPWKLKGDNKEKDVFLRYYHVFEENELRSLCKRMPNVAVIKSYYDQVSYAEVFNKCNKLEKYLVRKKYCSYNPDEVLDVAQIIARHGYKSETHVVVTEDGYILKVHRIPGSKEGKQIRQPIYLQHGLLGSSADWIINGNNSLGFLLADEGYDVWLGNARGNTYSKAHTSIPVTNPKFWNFSFHEMGSTDLPAVLYYINNTTSRPGEIIYIGHSMGTTMYFIFSSMYQQAAKNVKMMIALAPVAYMANIKSPIKYLAPFSGNIEWLTKHLGFNQFLPNNKIMRILSYQCELFNLNTEICENLIFAICGFDKEEFNEKILPVVLSKDPAGTSTKTMVHFAQEIKNNGNFQQFDYGSKQNMIEYGTMVPPNYNVSSIKTPIYLMYAMNDWLANHIDVQRLSLKLNSLAGMYRINLDTFNHVDFLFGKRAEELVYEPILEVIGNHTEYNEEAFG